jgi:predicted ribonuclease YlaK
MNRFQLTDLKVIVTSENQIDYYYTTRDFSKNNFKLYVGQAAKLVSEVNDKKTMLLLNTSFGIKILSSKNLDFLEFKPRDSKQLAYYHMLRSDFDMVVALGPAGTGKTTLALTRAIDSYFKQKKPIYLTKPTHTVQSHHHQAFGPVPGDVDEKYQPYINSFEIVLKKVLGDSANHYLNLMKEKNHLNFMPVEFTRGCTFENCTYIIDEVQNLTWHELKTVLSRVGQGAQIILCGDPYQIDAGFSIEQSGISLLLNSTAFAESDFTSHISLTKQYRGRMPSLVYEIDKEKDDLLNKF